jgi:hypothetical protein
VFDFRLDKMVKQYVYLMDVMNLLLQLALGMVLMQNLL